MFYIYKITNNINNKCYIGKTSNINRRFSDHKRLAFSINKDHKEYEKTLYRAFRKYGLENFSFEILEETDSPNDRESYWINFYDSIINGYNEGLGGLGGSLPGHCAGEKNGRAKLTEEDVIEIRKDYKNGLKRQQSYEKFCDKIGISGFADIWQGKSWLDIMPEIYTEENKKLHNQLEKNTAKTRRKLDTETIKKIRQAKQQGLKRKIAFEKYAEGKISFNTFVDIWQNKTYKEV